MDHRIIKIFFVMCILTLGIQNIQASGLYIYEQGQPNTGVATSGQAALANDASTAYFNPAGITRLGDSEILLGGQLSFMSVKFESDENNTLAGGNGGQAGGAFPGGGFYYVRKLKEKVHMGLSINAPVGIGLSYDDDWMGRYLIQNNFIAIIDLAPSLAYRANDQLSVGIGIDLYYAMMREDLAIFNIAADDGQAELKFDDWAMGYNIGVLFEPSNKTRIGIMYRSRADFKLEGDIDLHDIGLPWTNRGLEGTYGSTKLTLPQSLTLSLYQDMTDKLAALVDIGWSNWRKMEKTEITTQTGRVIVLPRKWKDTWRVGLGLQYRAKDQVLLKAGISYDSSPTKTEDRLPDLPVDRQWRLAAGVEYDKNKDTTITFNYVFIDLGKASIDKQFLISRRFSGNYDQHVHIINASWQWK